MKFSKRKKEKIRKINQKRIKKSYKGGGPNSVYIGHQGRWEVEDRTEIDNVIYFLIQNVMGNYGICKIIKVGQYVKLSDKRVLQNKELFSTPENWGWRSLLEIDSEGRIQNVSCPRAIECDDTILIRL